MVFGLIRGLNEIVVYLLIVSERGRWSIDEFLNPDLRSTLLLLLFDDLEFGLLEHEL